MLDLICDLSNKELLSLLAELKKQLLGEVRKGGRRIVSVGGEGQTVTYDLSGIKPRAAYRVVRRELVKRGCLEPKPRVIASLDMGDPCKPSCHPNDTEDCPNP